MNADSFRSEPSLISILEIIKQIGDAFVAVDFDGKVLFWSAGAEKLYLRFAEEMLGRAIAPVPVVWTVFRSF